MSQRRLLAAATAAAGLLLPSIFPSVLIHPASAAELDASLSSPSHLQSDHNHHRIPEYLLPVVDWGDTSDIHDDNHNHNQHQEFLYSSNDGDDDNDFDIGVADYQADFSVVAGLGRSLIGRAASDWTPLALDAAAAGTVSAGQTQSYVLLNTSVFAVPAAEGNGLPPGWSSSAGVSKRRVGVVAVEDLDEADLKVLLDEDDTESAQMVLEKRQTQGQTRPVYIAATTCAQPDASSGSGPSLQLTLYVSTSDSNQKPGPGSPPDQQTAILFKQGYANAMVQATGNVYVGIAAPPGSGQWMYQVSASTTTFYLNAVQNTTYGFILDTDSNSALITTQNLTDSTSFSAIQPWLALNATPPFQLFLFDEVSSAAFSGIGHSYCGVSLAAQTSLHINSSIITRNSGAPKQQFYATGLSPASSYLAVIGYQAAVDHDNATSARFAGGGGTIWASMNFTTKSDGNCQIVFGLPFCSDVAYAVPSNSSSNMSSLIDFYDSTAQAYYANFSLSLQQVACNSSDSAAYSLARNCTDCGRDYKNWLCAVTIPQCTDMSAADAGVIARNVASNTINGTTLDLSQPSLGLPANASSLPWYNSSRNPLIDTQIQPGPYKEFLPCINLCYEIVKSCPAVMGFNCPRQEVLLNKSYGHWDQGMPWPGSCKYLGKDPTMGGASATAIGLGVKVIFLVGVVHWVWTALFWI